jgi:hypothetical protein
MGYNVDAQGNRITGKKENQLGQARFLRTDDGTALMNVNGAPAGTPLVIFNGEGGDWPPSSGSTGSQTSGSAHTGSYGWDTGQISGGGDYSGWETTTSFDVQASYDSVQFWINPQERQAGANLLARWYEGGGAKGSAINVDDYVTDWDIGVWQHVVVPIADFGLPGSQLVDEFRFNYTAQGPKKQHYYYDEVELNPTGAGGGPYTFEVAAPDANTLYHVTMVNLIVVGTATGWDDSTFGNITALTNGVLFRHQDLSVPETLVSINSKDNVDLFGRYHPQDVVDFSVDRLVGFMIKPGKEADLTVTNQKVLQFVVRDDLSGLSNMRAFAHFGIEDIT